MSSHNSSMSQSPLVVSSSFVSMNGFSEVHRLREELASNKAKLVQWEEGIAQARNVSTITSLPAALPGMGWISGRGLGLCLCLCLCLFRGGGNKGRGISNNWPSFYVDIASCLLRQSCVPLNGKFTIFNCQSKCYTDIRHLDSWGNGLTGNYLQLQSNEKAFPVYKIQNCSKWLDTV